MALGFVLLVGASSVTIPAQIWFRSALTGGILRKMGDKAGDIVSVKDFGATGDGSTDDTTSVQAANDAASAAGKQLYFPAGTYKVSNLTHGTAPWIGEPRQSIISALNSGSAVYLVASPKWLEAGATIASSPWNRVYGIDFDAGGFKTYTVVLRTYYTKVENCRIYGSTDTDLLVSSDAQDATLLSSTMVNNEYLNNWIGVDGSTASYGLRVVDTNGKVTDHIVHGNYMSGSSIVALWVPIAAGWNITGNHFYGSGTSSAYIYKPNVGTVFANNYLEKEARFGSSNTASTTPFTYGPGNYFSTHVWADFNSTGHYIVSQGNTYSSTAELRHSFFSANKIMMSIGDTFGNATPFAHYASAGGSIQNASTGKFSVVGAAMTGIGRTITTFFDASGASSAVMHKPSSFDINALDTRKQAIGINVVSYSASMTPNAGLGTIQSITATNGTAFTINAPIGGPLTGQRLVVWVSNTSGGALGVITWNAAFHMAAFTAPGTGLNSSMEFIYDGTNWLQVGTQGPAVAN